jgi:hypothetical protein
MVCEVLALGVERTLTGHRLMSVQCSFQVEGFLYNMMTIADKTKLLTFRAVSVHQLC